MSGWRGERERGVGGWGGGMEGQWHVIFTMAIAERKI